MFKVRLSGRTKTIQITRNTQIPPQVISIGSTTSPIPRREPAKNLNKGKAEISWCHSTKNINAYLDYLCISGKELEYISAKEEQNSTNQNRSTYIHCQTDTNALFHSSKFSCTIVLTHKGGDCDTERTADHPVNCIDLTECCPCRNRFGTKGIQRTLNDYVGKAIHNRLQTSRQTDFYDHAHRCAWKRIFFTLRRKISVVRHRVTVTITALIP